jgi:hypothetical protein
MPEYWCHYCHEWMDSDYCEGHFESTHVQKGVTFEALKERMAWLGGLETREAPPELDESAPKKPKSWLWRDDNEDPNSPIVTNNFQHQR